jgi:hypothetical protein
MPQDPPDSSIVFVDHLSNRSHRHVLSHQDNHGIHEQRESATFSSPGNLDLFNSAIFAFGTRNATMDIGFKLKEIQVTPSSSDCIVHAAAWFLAFRARKFAAGFEINMNIELPSFNAKVH